MNQTLFAINLRNQMIYLIRTLFKSIKIKMSLYYVIKERSIWKNLIQIVNLLWNKIKKLLSKILNFAAQILCNRIFSATPYPNLEKVIKCESIAYQLNIKEIDKIIKKGSFKLTIKLVRIGNIKQIQWNLSIFFKFPI
jgi:hypothetical protein